MERPQRSARLLGDRRPLAACALAAGLLGCGGEAAPTGPPNVLLLSVDSLRQDHLSAYGYESNGPARESTTPTFDALAARGVLFKNARSTTSWTLPSHMALFTGLPDPLHGVVENRRRLADETVTLAQLFADAGYATGGFFSGPNLHPTFGFARGFEEYVDCSRVEVAPDAFEGLDQKPVGSLQGLHRSSHTVVTSPGLVEAASRYAGAILDRGRRPLFCFVHWWDPHYDYLAPPAYVQRFTRGDYNGRFRGDYLNEKSSQATARDAQHLRELYDAEIRFTDDEIGRLLDAFEERGALDSTVVVYTADHGEEFYEHDRWGHQRTLFEPSVRIPIAIAGPGVPNGVRASGRAQIHDLYPTLASLCGLDVPGYVEGRDLAARWLDPTSAGPASF
ncbi:MAG: sulfatase, partial [Planctomycetota bacterium]